MAGVGESDGLLTSTVRPIVLLRIVHFPPFASELSRSPRRRQAGGRRHPLRCATNRQEASRCSASALSLKQTDGHSLNTLRPSTLHTSLSWAGFSKMFVLGSLVALRDLEDARAVHGRAGARCHSPPRGVSSTTLASLEVRSGPAAFKTSQTCACQPVALYWSCCCSTGRSPLSWEHDRKS